MGRVNITLTNGQIVSVDENDPLLLAQQSAGQNASVTDPEVAGDVLEARRLQEYRDERYGGPAGAVLAFGGHFRDAVTFGLAGRLDKWAAKSGLPGSDVLTDPVTGEPTLNEAGDEHPVAGEAGTLAALITPGGEAEMAGQVGRGVAEAVGGGVRTERAVRGALIGAGSTVAHANATGDPLTAESLLIGAGVGGVLDFGAGALGDRLTGAQRGAQDALEARASENAAEAVFDNDSPAYDGVRDARSAARSASAEANRDVAAGARKYANFWENPSRAERVFDGLERGVGVLKDDLAERFPAAGVDADLSSLGTEMPPEPEMAPAEAAAHAEYSAQIADFETRLGEIRTLYRAGNTDAAARLSADMRDRLVEASPTPVARAVPVLPPPPGTPVPHLDAELPATLRAFARTTPDKIATVANYLNDWGAATSSESEAVGRLADELGVQRAATPGETLTNVHQFARDHTAVLDAMERAGDPKASKLGNLLRWAAKKAVRTAVGGSIGGALFGAGGRTAGELFGMFAGDATASAAAEARSALRERVQRLVATYAGKAGRGVRSLGPVTAQLSRSFPSGRRDRETDLGALALNRTRELAAAATTAPDTAYHAVAPLMAGGAPVAKAVHQRVVATLSAALAASPKDPGTNPGAWRPGPTEAVEVAYRLEALRDPERAAARLLSGDVHPAAVDALRTYWPEFTRQIAQELAANPTTRAYPRGAGVSALLGPQSGADDPLTGLAVQGLYLPKPSPAPTPQSGSPGRPPKAGRTDVAGSNVDLLTNQ